MNSDFEDFARNYAPRDVRNEDPREYRRRCVDVDPRLILQEFTEISTHIQYWGYRRVKAQRHVADGKITHDEAKARLELEADRLQLVVRAELSQDPTECEKLCGVDSRGNAKFPTEAVIKAKVHTHPDYQDALESYQDAARKLVELKAILASLEVTCKALETKENSLVQISADRRAELRTSPDLRKLSREIRQGDEP